jgi:iron complex outermembrane receptor protein
MTEFEMRGVASTGGNSPTVGFYYDDTSLTAPSASNEGKIVISPALYDLNRVEVLRGPQGTLYGSGSMGGTIKVVPERAEPRKPSTPRPRWSSATPTMAVSITARMPWSICRSAAGSAALRIVGSYSHDAGWIDRIVIAPGEFPFPNGSTRGDVWQRPWRLTYHDVNDVERTSVRVSAVIKPIEGLSITPSFFYQKLSVGRFALH